MTLIAVLFMQYETPEKATASAHRFRGCPKVHFWGNNGKDAYVILKVPDGQRFWSDFIGENPEKSFGGIEASLEYLDHLYSPMSFSREPSSKGERSPCYSLCPECLYYTNPYNRCAATRHKILQHS